MKLQYDGLFLKKENKQSKNGNEYYIVTVKDPVLGKLDKLYFFENKLIDKINSLEENDNIVIIFDYYYSKFTKKYILKPSDVVLC